jgi:hypothetical protein
MLVGEGNSSQAKTIWFQPGQMDYQESIAGVAGCRLFAHTNHQLR